MNVWPPTVKNHNALNIVCRIIIRKNVALIQLQLCLGDNTNLYINLRRSCNGTLFSCSAVRVCYLPVRFGQLLRCAHKRIVDIMEQHASGISTIA